MNPLKELTKPAIKIEAAGLSRIYQYTQEHDTGTISAFRPEYSRQENLTRSSILAGLLRKEGYTTIQVQGIYQYEDGSTGKESSFFVVDRHDRGNLFKSLLELGSKFEQESISYADRGQDFALYATNSQYKLGTKIAIFRGKKFGEKGVSYSTIRGRPFAWDNYKETKIDTSIKSALYKGRFTPNGALTRDIALKQLKRYVLGKENTKGYSHLTDYVRAMKEDDPTNPITKFFIEDCEL